VGRRRRRDRHPRGTGDDHHDGARDHDFDDFDDSDDNDDDRDHDRSPVDHQHYTHHRAANDRATGTASRCCRRRGAFEWRLR
jgi:hypothetical protein